MSELVKKYLECSKKGFQNPSDDNIQKVRDEMTEIKKQFSEEDWEELIDSVPSYMKPMVKEQKDKYLK